MRSKKTFDCVEMKDQIHAELAARYAGLTDEEMLRQMREALETSEDPVARKWRSLRRSRFASAEAK